MAKPPTFSLARFCMLFILLLIVSYVVSSEVGVPGTLTHLNAQALDQTLRAIGYSSRVNGANVDTGGIRLVIITECTGLHSMVILGSAILAYPAPALAKGIGVLLGSVFIMLTNLFRLLSVALVGHHWPRLVHSFHVYLWQVTLLVMIVLAWVFWIRWVSRTQRHGEAPTEATSESG